jgi:hypothetical protein
MGDLPDLGKVNSIVPDLYYDLIARVVPGTAFVVLVILTCEPSRRFVTGQDFSKTTLSLATVLLFVLLGLGYTSGLLATSLGNMSRCPYTKLTWRVAMCGSSELKRVLAEKFGFSLTDRTKVSDCQSCYRRMHDYIRSQDASPRTLVLSKMQAEASLCANLSASALLLFCLHLGSNFWLYPPGDLRFHSAELLVNFIVVLVASCASIDRNVRLLERHFVVLQRLERQQKGTVFSLENAS